MANLGKIMGIDTAHIVIAETEVFSGTSPDSWTDLDLSATIGSQVTFVILKINAVGGDRTIAVRKNGDADEFYSASMSFGAAMGDVDANEFGVFVVVTDASGIIEWITEVASASTTVDIIAYIK